MKPEIISDVAPLRQPTHAAHTPKHTHTVPCRLDAFLQATHAKKDNFSAAHGKKSQTPADKIQASRLMRPAGVQPPLTRG